MRAMASRSRLPIRGPSRSRRTLTTLSAMTCETLRNPFAGEGSIVMRKSGAPTIVLVIGRIETVACDALKESDCTITAGRGFPNSPWRATVTISPRFKRSSRRFRRRFGRPIGRCLARHVCEMPEGIAGGIRARRQESFGHRATDSLGEALPNACARDSGARWRGAWSQLKASSWSTWPSLVI
jgi:hypothetical protein